MVMMVHYCIVDVLLSRYFDVDVHIHVNILLVDCLLLRILRRVQILLAVCECRVTSEVSVSVTISVLGLVPGFASFAGS